MREWLSWWSTTLPRSGPRVRVPSRALCKIQYNFIYARVAQLVEHDLAKVGAAGSSPVSRFLQDIIQFYICASGSVGGARPCQGRGRGFESRLALLLIVAEALILQGFRSFYVVVVKLFCNICGQIQKLLHIKYT